MRGDREKQNKTVTFQQQPRIQNMFAFLKKTERRKGKRKNALKLSIKMMSGH